MQQGLSDVRSLHEHPPAHPKWVQAELLLPPLLGEQEDFQLCIPSEDGGYMDEPQDKGREVCARVLQATHLPLSLHLRPRGQADL